ncbi:MAG TPA: FHA domain-containing protein [Gemmataceae bacterium]|nr:FHA domain-containing protein [Gemmataceae bacterium]
MDSTITLIATRGPLSGQKFVFAEPSRCYIGRSRDCTIALPHEEEHLDVSRHHCLLEITPPALRVRDLGSLNGTFVNDKKIGQRGMPVATGDSDKSAQPAVALIDGDEIRLGEHTAFRVCVFTGEWENVAQRPRRSSGELRFEEPVHS